MNKFIKIEYKGRGEWKHKTGEIVVNTSHIVSVAPKYLDEDYETPHAEVTLSDGRVFVLTKKYEEFLNFIGDYRI